jgi:hypothetical protein
VMGLLVSGGTVNNTKLMRDDEAGEPETDTSSKPRLPIIGPILVAFLPLAACAAGVYMASSMLGQDVVSAMSTRAVAQTLPTSLPDFWAFLRDGITIVERMVSGLLNLNLVYWKTIAFLYLAVCLTVRMAPLPGNLRGSLGAIVLVGVLVAMLGTAVPSVLDAVLGSWALLTFSVGVLLLLLMVSLMVRGLVGLIKVLATQG